MKLRGQQQGYAMVTLLIGMSVAAVLMSAVMPVWKQMAIREKEAELVFRGEQYRRAIGLFQRRNGPGTLPPNVDTLVQQRFLRKKYKDPITNDEFDPILQGQATAIGSAAPGQQPATAAGGRGQTPPQPSAASGFRPLGTTPGSAFGGLMGVVSKSKEKSIRVYNGRTNYNEWQFVYVPQTPAAGGAPGASAPGGVPGVGGRGGRGGRGERGQQPFPPGQRGLGPGERRGFPPPDGRGGTTFTPFGPDGRQPAPAPPPPRRP